MKDATYWADQLKQKQISFSELVALFKAQYQQKNPALNAITQWDEAIALETYQKLANPNETLFGGLPVALKDLGQDKAGFLAQAGSRLLEGYRASQTDNFVKQVQNCGLIPLAKTNVPEFGFKNVTDADLHGLTKNPWDQTKTPGGSSGGAAAAVASGMFPLAMASDGGGSIRIPASYCSLLGLKPTRGTMPVGPNGLRGWQGASINFALGVSVRDITKLFYGMRMQTNPAAPYQPPYLEWQHQADNWLQNKPLKIAVCTASPVDTPVSDDAILAVKQATKFLEEQGHQVEEITYPVDGKALIAGYYAMNGAETAAMLANFDEKVLFEKVEALTWAIYNYGKHIIACEYTQILQQWDQAAQIMENLFEKYDLFLSPTTAVSAPTLNSSKPQSQDLTEMNKEQLATLVDEMFAKSLSQTPYTQLANLTGQPAISLPTYLSEANLPLGIQFMAAKGREDLLFSVAALFERAGQFKLPTFYL